MKKGIGKKMLWKKCVLNDSHLREIYGFAKCTSLCRLEIPSSSEKIGCRFRRTKKLQRISPFIHYENEDRDVRHSRRHIDLGIGGKKFRMAIRKRIQTTIGTTILAIITESTFLFS
jgi:hypothetical protein